MCVCVQLLPLPLLLSTVCHVRVRECECVFMAWLWSGENNKHAFNPPEYNRTHSLTHKRNLQIYKLKLTNSIVVGHNWTGCGKITTACKHVNSMLCHVANYMLWLVNRRTCVHVLFSSVFLSLCSFVCVCFHIHVGTKRLLRIRIIKSDRSSKTWRHKLSFCGY